MRDSFNIDTTGYKNPDIWDERPMTVQLAEEKQLLSGEIASKRVKLSEADKKARKKRREQAYYLKNRDKIIEKSLQSAAQRKIGS